MAENFNLERKASIPSPQGATEGSSLEKDTIGGQLFSIKQKEKVTGIPGTTPDELSVSSVSQDIESRIRDLNISLEPVLIAPKPYVLQEVQKWLSSPFMVALASSFTAIAMMNKEIHKVEGAWMVKQIINVWRSAEDIAALIMAKAEKEAAMHMALAIAAVASLAIAILGAALTVAGKSMSAKAKSKLATIDEGLPEPPKPHKQVAAGAGRDVGPETPVEKPFTLDKRKTEQLPVEPEISHKPKPAVEEAAPPTKLDRKQELIKKERDGEALAGIAQAVTMSTQPVSQIFENLIQMFFKPQIARFEQQIELARAAKELAGRALDSASQGMASAGQSVDGAMQAWVKEMDENTRAHNLGRG